MSDESEPSKPSREEVSSTRSPKEAELEEKKEKSVEVKEEEDLASSDESEKEDETSRQLTAAMFAGPVPPPPILRGYDTVVDDGAERIMAMAEKEQDHRHSLEERRIGLFERGQWFGFILGLVTLGCGTYLLTSGNSVTGFGTLLLGVGSIVASLLFREKPSSGDNASEKLSESEGEQAQ